MTSGQMAIALGPLQQLPQRVEGKGVAYDTYTWDWDVKLERWVARAPAKSNPYIIDGSKLGLELASRKDVAKLLTDWRRQRRRIKIERLSERVCYSHGGVTAGVPTLF